MSEKIASLSWAHLRFSIVGALLARPPKAGELGEAIRQLAEHDYAHPTKPQTRVRFGASTIERWYYQALGSDDPIRVLSRKVRRDTGTTKAMSPQLVEVLGEQRQHFPQWSYRLHADNLAAYMKERPELGDPPSYASVRREMVRRGWIRSRRPRSSGEKRALDRLEKWEVRSFESEYVNALWHLDYHESSRRVVDSSGTWHTPKVLCILDDRTRLCCHIQWYLSETAENLIHGLTQAFFKRGLPRALMTDNGSAMMATETTNGLSRLGILHENTLPYSPYQNGKQEAFWGSLEGKLIAMLSHINPLTLEFLNHATQAWVEQHYHRSHHTEIGTTPLECFIDGKNVSRTAPSGEELRLAFSVEEVRKQRKSDGTVQIKGVRFEIPSRFRHVSALRVRYQSWDVTQAFVVDEKTGHPLTRILPLDKIKNARGHRRVKPDGEAPKTTSTPKDPIPPLLRSILADYAATGLPPAYIPKDELEEDKNNG